MERREIIGSVVQTTLSSAINNTVLSFSVADGSTFPTGSDSPFVLVLDRGQLNEEKLLISSRASNTFTVLERGYDGTPASPHLINADVDHVVDAISLQDVNRTTYDNEILFWMEA